MVDDGSFLVVWRAPRNAFGPGLNGVLARAFSKDGAPLGGNFLVAAATGGVALRRPRIATGGGGIYVVVVETDEAGGDVFHRRIAADGTPIGAVSQVNGTGTFGPQRDAAVAMGKDGEYVAVWQSHDALPGGGGSGDYVIAGQRFARDGERLGEEFHVTTSAPRLVAAPAVVKDGAGNFTVFWADFGSPGRGFFGRRFAIDGEPLGAPFRLGAASLAPVAVAMELHGDFVAAWSRPGADGEDGLDDVFARRFGPDGVPLGREVQVNTHTAGRQAAPALGRDRLGNLVVAWESDGQDGGGTGVFARLLALPEVPAEALLRLRDGRFELDATWRDFAGGRGQGQAIPLPGDSSGVFWFFDPANVEVIVKLIDGRAFNGFWWVFYGALSSVEYYFTVFDTATGATRTYFNPRHHLASAGDTAALGPEGEDQPLAAVAPPHPRAAGIIPGDCRGTGEVLCLEQDRFAVEVAWRDFAGATGTGHAAPLTDDTGTFWFFRPDNPELAVKVIDARLFNGHFWVFYGSLTNVEFTLKVTDTRTGAVRTYTNPLHQFGSQADTAAFPEVLGIR
jgi:hypothetical protein